MTRCGLVLGLVAVVGLMGWGAVRAIPSAHAQAAEQVPATTAESADEDTTHDEAVHRYRTGQSNHWRHVMVGRR
jgi:hypothetical protein